MGSQMFSNFLKVIQIGRWPFIPQPIAPVCDKRMPALKLINNLSSKTNPLNGHRSPAYQQGPHQAVCLSQERTCRWPTSRWTLTMSHQGNANQNHSEIALHSPVGMTTVKTRREHQVSVRMWSNWNAHELLGERG